jgi:hypothetical protein
MSGAVRRFSCVLLSSYTSFVHPNDVPHSYQRIYISIIIIIIIIIITTTTTTIRRLVSVNLFEFY